MPDGSSSVRAHAARHRWLGFESLGVEALVKWLRGPLGLALILVVGLSGCDQSAEIVVERVPKDDLGPATPPEVSEPASTPQRMLAAMILGKDEAIFFKVTGPPDLLETQRGAFLELVSSFKPGDPPQWTAPEGWTESAGPAPRLATIIVPTEPPQELSVTSLSLPESNQDAYRLANINRWRGQLGLGPIEKSDLNADAESDAETFTIPLAGETVATVVDITGESSGGMMRPPFASMAAPSGGGGSEETGETGNELTFETPQGWTETPGNAFSQAAFAVDDAKVTVSGLSASANNLLANVNRWRRQVDLEPIEETELKEQVQTITLGDGEEGNYIVLAGSQGTSMLGVIAVRDGTMWFVKMMGGEETIAREKPRFEQFVKSLQFK